MKAIPKERTARCEFRNIDGEDVFFNQLVRAKGLKSFRVFDEWRPVVPSFDEMIYCVEGSTVAVTGGNYRSSCTCAKVEMSIVRSVAKIVQQMFDVESAFAVDCHSIGPKL